MSNTLFPGYTADPKKIFRAGDGFWHSVLFQTEISNELIHGGNNTCLWQATEMQLLHLISVASCGHGPRHGHVTMAMKTSR